MLAEAVLLGLVGGLLGLGLGRAAATVAARLVARGKGPAFTLPGMSSLDLAIVGIGTALSLLAAIIPSVVAYRLRPAQVLRA